MELKLRPGGRCELYSFVQYETEDKTGEEGEDWNDCQEEDRSCILEKVQHKVEQEEEKCV